jgi:lysozyme
MIIDNYETFLLKEHINWIDSEIIKESVRDNISLFLRKTFKKMKELPLERKKTLLIYALSSLLAITNAKSIYNHIINDSEIRSELDDCEELEEVINNKLNVKSESEYFNPVKMKLSKKGWNDLKIMEGDAKNPGEPKLVGYELDDGRITIGWGHAEKIENSTYKVGQRITREEAQRLLQEDATIAADGVRRIFKEWEKQGIKIKLNQDQFDALVSMAFNMGVAGLRRSETIKAIKKGDFEKAGELIKTESINKDFERGLMKRRSKESDMFLSYLN